MKFLEVGGILNNRFETPVTLCLRLYKIQILYLMGSLYLCQVHYYTTFLSASDYKMYVQFTDGSY